MSKFIPDSFQVPNAFIDETLATLIGNACKIYLLIVRKTRGWHKEADKISYSQIQKYTGIGSSATVDKAVSELVGLGLISYRRGNEKSANEYRLNDVVGGTLKTEVGGTSKTELATLKNEVATLKTEVGGTSKTEDTEIQYIKNTNYKYNTHARTSENSDHLNNSEQQSEMVKKLSSSSNDFGEQKTHTPAKKSKTKHSEQKPVDVKAYLAELGVSKQASDDFIDFRKQLKRPLTITAVNRLVNEANKAGLTVEQAIEYALFKGWHSFSANYYHNSEQQPQLNQGQNYARQSYQHNHQQSETEQYAQSLQQQFNAKYNQPQAGRVVDADFLDLEKPF